MEKKSSVDIDEREARARKFHAAGYNCCQAVVLAYADMIDGLSEDVAERMSASFGRGIAGMHEVCGCVSGMAMIMGLAGKPKAAKVLAQRFGEEHGSVVCRSLLGIDGSGIKHKPCVEYVAFAARLLGEELSKEDV